MAHAFASGPQSRGSSSRGSWVCAVDAPGELRNEARQAPVRRREFTSSVFKKVAMADAEGWQRLAVAVARYARRKCGKAGIPRQDSDDLGQEVCLDILRHLHAFRFERTGDNLHKWVRAITQAKIADYFRTRARRAEGKPVGGPEPELAQIPEQPRDTGEFLADDDPRARILRATMALVRTRVQPQTWEAFCALTFEDRDATEVAAKLQMTPHAVREAVYRVCDLLKEYATLLAKLRDDSS